MKATIAFSSLRDRPKSPISAVFMLAALQGVATAHHSTRAGTSPCCRSGRSPIGLEVAVMAVRLHEVCSGAQVHVAQRRDFVFAPFSLQWAIPALSRKPPRPGSTKSGSAVIDRVLGVLRDAQVIVGEVGEQRLLALDEVARRALGLALEQRPAELFLGGQLGLPFQPIVVLGSERADLGGALVRGDGVADAVVELLGVGAWALFGKQAL